VGVVGYAFLESPGNPYDGIDNDGDNGVNALYPGTAPTFVPEDFQPRAILPGDDIVLIDNDYNRTIVRVGGEAQKYATFGDSIFVDPGVTLLAEGNVIMQDGVDVINPNAYDGIDNDLDGLIDENYYLHYRQIRKDQDGNVLIDRLNPVQYKNYITGQGVGDYMIDERRNDGIDNDGDWNPDFDDVGADGLLATSDRGEGDGLPTAGEPNFDQTDVDESDQIGLTSFEYFSPAGEFSMADDEEMWDRMRPGHFEVPSSIVNNKPERGEDGDFIYGSGYFPLRAGETQYFSLALVYGEGGGPQVDIEDLLNNRETVQKIYDSDYRFPPAPDKPTLVAVPGDGEVTLYWDRKSEKSFDPVLKEFDFEGYKIYRSTDHNFNEVFNITDATGAPIAYKPLVQYDVDNNVQGYFQATAELYQQGRGASFYLGDNSGLQHQFVDTDVENGKRYFYAIVAYDRGDQVANIFPKENNKRIDLLPSGEVRTFQNTAVVIPNAQVAGYTPPDDSQRLVPVQAIGTGAVYSKVIDESVQTGHTYRLEFLDSSNDNIDNDGDWSPTIDDVGSDGLPNTDDADGTEGNGLPDNGEPNADSMDSDEYFVPITTSYSVRDITGIMETFVGNDTFQVVLEHAHIIPETFSLKDALGQIVDPSKYELNVDRGRIRGQASGDLIYGNDYKAAYEYYAVYQSTYIEGNPEEDETLDTDIFDGLQLSFHNYWKVTLDTANTYWSNPAKAYNFNFNIIDTYVGSDRLLGLRHPADYRIIFANNVVDTSLADPTLFVKAIPVNFSIYNATEEKYIDFIYNDLDRNEKLTPFDEIIFVEDGNNGEQIFTWDVFFTSLTDTSYEYVTGDTLVLNVKKPFRSGDVFEIVSIVPEVDEEVATSSIDNIKVVPNPYVVATAHELPLPPAITSGRGTRKIDFIHLPAGATIHIFTSRGEHVVTLEHDSNIHDGTVAWNLKTKENLDVAAGIYFYVVESDVGTKRGKIGIIK
ncbi:hypothetical protein KAR48_20740, partial [bacterium]|nr:hypothetical protein [bacterium]